METTFASEDVRKTHLFDGWIAFLRNTHQRVDAETFEETYEGLVGVDDVARDHVLVTLDDGSREQRIPITPEISAWTRPRDTMYLVLGRRDDEWVALDVISIASLAGEDPTQFHMTVNPLLIPPGASMGPH